VPININSFYQNADLLFRYPDLASFLRERWEDRFLQNWDANDLITLLHTWQNGDVSKIRHDGDLQACLTNIQAKGLIMPSKTDLYFPVCNIFSSFSFSKDDHATKILIARG